MDDYGPETYGERVADVYDEWYVPPNTAGECDFLAELAAGGRALELGIGTGRVAIPLAARGVEVHGIDSSPAMVAQLRAKPGGADIPVVVGDMADVPVDGEFALVFIVFNTFFMLPSQAEQVRCFRNVAAHLAPGGRFVMHAFVPDTSRIERGQDLSVREAGLDRVRLDATVYDATGADSSTRRRCASPRPVCGSSTPSCASRSRPSSTSWRSSPGLELESRFSTFTRAPFTGDSVFAVSVYRRA